MEPSKASYQYFICRDDLNLILPNETYSIQELLEEYKINPTFSLNLAYYKTKEFANAAFEKFIIREDLKVRKMNDIKANKVYNIEVLVLFDREWKVENFACREIKDDIPTEKKVLNGNFVMG